MVQVFDFTDYKLYLVRAIDIASAEKRGVRSRLAEAMGVHPSFITSVLTKKAQLSLEHAERASHFFVHGEEECRYFLLLVNLARAGTPGLRRVLEKQIEEERQKYINLKKRFRTEPVLSGDDLNTFFSSCHYSAILNALTIPSLQTREALSAHLRIESERVGDVLQFLERSGLIRLKNGKFAEVRSWVHLADNPAIIARDHANWRLYSIRACERQKNTDLHYSSVITLSEADLFRVKRILLEALDKAREIIKPSKEEKLCSLLLDFFEV
jgi:uncharacterized protein (TIGR02147 family)